jgi:pilus assembly protein CpaB
MSPVRLIILLVAAGAAIAAVFLVRSAQTPAPAAAAAATTIVKSKEVAAKQVLVARHEIPIGKFVTADDLRWQDWPEDSPTGAFIEQKKEPEALEKMAGAVARFSLVEGEPVTLTKMVHPGASSFMAALLNPGMRAVSIEIAPETAAGGFIQPNDRVDVIVTRELEDATAGGANTIQKVRSDLILGNIRVLAIDGIYGPPAAEGENPGQGAALIGTRATLELTDQDSTLINAAKKAGELALTLRSISDLQSPSGATGYGRVYRDGVAQSSEGVRIYRFGTETATSAPAG